MGHSEESGEDAGELSAAFSAGSNALGALKSGPETSTQLLEVPPRMGYSAALRMTVLKLVK